jgi:cytochrome c556
MSNLKRAIIVLAAVASLQFSVGARADNQDVIDYRQHIMNTLNEQAAALGEILSGAIPDDNVVSHIDALALTAATALKAFVPKVPGGEARPEVWSQWDDFSRRMNDFAQQTASMAKIAHAQGKEAALAKVMDALSCKKCHDSYRREKRAP